MVKCVLSKTTMPDGSLQHVYTVSVKTNMVSSLFPHTPTASQTQQGTPGHAEARRDIRGGRWSLGVLCQTHRANWGQLCSSTEAIMNPPFIVSQTGVHKHQYYYHSYGENFRWKILWMKSSNFNRNPNVVTCYGEKFAQHLRENAKVLPIFFFLPCPFRGSLNSCSSWSCKFAVLTNRKLVGL